MAMVMMLAITTPSILLLCCAAGESIRELVPIRRICTVRYLPGSVSQAAGTQGKMLYNTRNYGNALQVEHTVDSWILLAKGVDGNGLVLSV